MKNHTVKELAELAGVSVRTLHYYDEIGLLKPASRNSVGYRLYGENELLRLQQILFYREMEVPLEEIKEIIDNSEFDTVEALKKHRNVLGKKIARLERLRKTVDRTIEHLKGERLVLNDKELYEGFTGEQAVRYRKEARELFGEEIVERTEQRIKKLSKRQWNDLRTESENIAREFASFADMEPSDVKVQEIVARHHSWIENFYPAPKDRYLGLGQLYSQHPEFKAFYEKFRPGLAEFIKKAIEYFCENTLK